MYIPLTIYNLFKERDSDIMEREFFIYISSEKSKLDFPFNTTDDFQIQLPEYITFDSNWVCSLKEINIHFSPSATVDNDILIMSDICGVSFFHSLKLPILRRLFLKNTQSGKKLSSFFLDPFYLPVKQNKINTVRVYIRKSDNQRLSFSSGAVNLTLHFKYIGN